MRRRALDFVAGADAVPSGNGIRTRKIAAFGAMLAQPGPIVDLPD